MPRWSSSPNEGFADYTEPIFPDGTTDFFQFLRNNAPDSAPVELAIEDQDYKELVLHFDVLVLPTILVSSLLLPTAAQLIANYIERRRGSRSKDTEVRASILVHRTDGQRKETIKIGYEGPADAFKREMSSAIQSIAGRAETSGVPPTPPPPSTPQALPAPALEQPVEEETGSNQTHDPETGRVGNDVG